MSKKKKVKKVTNAERLVSLTKFVSEIKDKLERDGTAVVDVDQLEKIKKMLCGTPGNPCT